MFLGREPKWKIFPVFVNYKQLYKESKKILDSLKLNIDPYTVVRHLSVAEQQMVEIAKVISSIARIIIMDKSTSSLSDREIEHLFATIKYLKTNDVSIIYITHRLEEVKKVGDRVTILRDGKFIGTIKAQDAHTDVAVSEPGVQGVLRPGGVEEHPRQCSASLRS